MQKIFDHCSHNFFEHFLTNYCQSSTSFQSCFFLLQGHSRGGGQRGHFGRGGGGGGGAPRDSFNSWSGPAGTGGYGGNYSSSSGGNVDWWGN